MTAGVTAPTRIRTPDQRLRVFVSSTLGELADERRAARHAVEQLRLAPIMFELGARPHPPRALYRSYLEQSDVFVAIYWQRYGWVAPDMAVSGLEDEYLLSEGMPRLVYVKRPAADMEPRLGDLLARVQAEDSTSYKPFRDAAELESLLADDLAILLAERFDRADSVAAPAAASNLPSPPSSFVGRAGLLARLEPLLMDDGVRVVTLTGSGGIGKTRLALAAARAQLHRFEDGVFFVDLSEQRTPDDAYAAIVHEVPLGDTRDDPPLEALKRGLRDRHALLVLDNFEQVMAAGAGVSELLEHCPRLQAMVTSREALRIRGERRFPVSSLSLPPGGGGGGLTATAALESEAVRLFRERAVAVRPDFEVTDANAADVVAICARLDALPLAIELAAARVNVFSVDELRLRLERQLHLLGSGGHDLPERQQTLRGAIEWSNDLLSDSERAVFRLFSVFADARLADVEAAAGRVPALSLDVLESLASLVDKSLVQSASGIDGRPRFSMLQTIRDYAAEQLDSEPDLAAGIRRAHAERYSELANDLRESANMTERDEVLSRLSSELGNLLVAWSYWTANGDVGRLNDLLELLWGYYDARGNYRAAAGLGENLLGVLARQPETPQRLRDQLTLETSLARSLVAVTGFSSDSEKKITEVLERSASAGQGAYRYPALRSLSQLHMMRSDFARSAEVAADLLVIAEEQRDQTLLADANLVCGVVKLWANDMPAALRHIEKAVEYGNLARPSFVQVRVGPDPRVLSQSVSGLVTWMGGYPDQARARVERGVELAREIDHPYSLGYSLFHAGLLDLWSQDLVVLVHRTDELLKVADTHDYPIWRALGHVLRGTARVASGDGDGGLGEVDEGFGLYEGLSTPPIFWPALLTIRSRANLLAGRVADAVSFLDEAERCIHGDDPLIADLAIARGDVLLAGMPPDRAAGEQAFEHALDLARAHGLRMVELEALTRLTTLRIDTPGEQSAVHLSDLLTTFTEGFTTPQLRAAFLLARTPDS